MRLGDSDLWVDARARRRRAARTRSCPAGATRMRDGLGVRAERGGVEIAIVGGLRARPGARRAARRRSASATAGSSRSAGPGTRTRWTASTSCSTPARRSFDARGTDRHARRRRLHVHWLSPQVVDAALAGGLTTLRHPGLRARSGTSARTRPRRLAATWAALEGDPAERRVAGARAPRRGPSRSRTRSGAAAPGSRSTRTSAPARSRSAARSTSPTATTSSSRSTPTASTRRCAWRTPTPRFGGPDGARLPHRGRRRRPRARPARARRARARADVVDDTRPCRSASAPRPSTWRWSPPCTCSSRDGAPGDAAILRHRVRPWTMAAESVLHDLGVIRDARRPTRRGWAGRRGGAARVPVRRRDEGAARRRSPARPTTSASCATSRR